MKVGLIEEMTVAIGPLEFFDGHRLEAVEQRVTIYGDRSLPVVLVAHALTGSSRVADWWPGMVGDGQLFDPNRFCIVGINTLGGCYGSSGPQTVDPFPRVTVRDIVAAEARALDALGIAEVDVVIGGSLGGMQALQWALDCPHRVKHAVMLGAHDHQSAMGIALNAIQRDAIAIDPALGLRVARKIAMLSYKSSELLRSRHERRPDRKGRFRFDVEGYLEHQADLFEARMDPRSYVALTHAMDSFDVRDHAAARTSRSLVPRDDQQPKLLFVGISSDWLFEPGDVRAAAERFARLGYDSEYREIQSDHGHDAFLAEPKALTALLASAPSLATLF
ncbi:MAG TPA: alpha/beta fold hydrolase [Candidatus Rubrimentiphilum sp.]|nr:alpha/beta fold hydrolase [Candidatus Rubrimentiphilum sp.]